MSASPLLRSVVALALALPLAASHAEGAHDDFMAKLASLCGQRFEGTLSYPADPRHDLAGKTLSADIATCTASEIRVPFHVGHDRSRTWIFTRTPSGLQLKHDHRHPDGSPDAVSMYGGMAQGAGSSLQQSFAADAYTGQLIEGAATNVWTITLSPDSRTLTYHLDRDARPRATVVLTRVTQATRPAAVRQPASRQIHADLSRQVHAEASR